MPILSLISRSLTYLVPSEEPEDQDQASVFLDPLLLQTPSLALSQAAREELRILDLLKLMLRTVWRTRSGHDRRLRVATLQDRIITIHDALKNYLGQIGDESLSKSDIDWRFNLLDYAQELRIVATLIRRDLTEAWVQTARSTKELGSADMAELEKILSRTLERMQKAMVLLMTQDVHLANQFIQEKDEISNHYRAIRKHHLELLPAGQNPETSFFDLLNCFRRINTHLTSIAFAILQTTVNGGAGTQTVSPDLEEVTLSQDSGFHPTVAA